jgi:hypothetical protein
MDIDIGSPDVVTENSRHQELLAWATSRIDLLAEKKSASDHLCGLLDWMAYFTREHFGFQQRLLTECSQQREYLFDRIAVYGEFRRKLAQLCLDSMRGDASVPERLRILCHELLQDAQAHQERFSDMVCNSASGPRLRRKLRRGQLVADAAQAFESRVPTVAADRVAA